MLALTMKSLSTPVLHYLSKHMYSLAVTEKSMLQADIVRGYKEIEDEIEKLLVEELPKLEMVDIIELNKKGWYSVAG